MDFSYIEDFKKYGFGLFIHFGLYSVLGKGEWYLSTNRISKTDYEKLTDKFNISKNWAKELVSTAKKAGCKYITLTTRHHDGFSLYDTCGLNTFDAPHSACKRDLIKEFTEECNKQGIVPFFYHTLLDWHVEEYKTDFKAYIDYLVKSVEILCKNYGKIGGFWFDGMWDKVADWQEDRLYATIRKYQPQTMIINNTGLDQLGKVGHSEIDSVTFERGKPKFVDTSNKPIAGEMCQGITDHWGYAKDDISYKSPIELIETLMDCRKYNCNLLLNTGLKGDGRMNVIERESLLSMGKWIKANKGIVYSGVPAGIEAENADIFTDGKYYYASITRVPMCFNYNVTRIGDSKHIVIKTDKKIKNAIWLDNNEKIKVEKDNTFNSWPFDYGTSYGTRIARFTLK